MTRVLSVIAILVGFAAAVREESRQEAFLEEGMEQEMEMGLVPAKISKAIRRAGRLAEEAMKVAEEQKANMTDAKEAAAVKAEAASKQQEISSKALDEAAKKRDAAQQKKKAAEEAMLKDSTAQAAVKESVNKLQAMEDKLKDEDAKYRAFKEELNQKMKKLADEKIAAAEALDKLKDDLSKLKEETESLKMEAAAKGGLKEEATDAAEAAEAEMDEAEAEAEKQQAIAEKAQNDFIAAKADADQAAQMFFEANTELKKKTAMFDLVESVRNKTDDFYKALDKMTLSMEDTLRKQKGQDGARPAHELIREDENVKASMVMYNEMVITFKELHSKSKEFYHFVSASITEIHDNANAAFNLQCDPTEELELSLSKEEFNKKCGKGVWDDYGLEIYKFPKHKHDHKAKLPESL